MKSIFALLLLIAGFVPAVYAADMSSITLGVIDATPLDTPGGVIGTATPSMAGIEGEVAFKDSPYSVKVQWRTGTVGGGMTAIERNMYAQYNLPTINEGATPYFGLGFSQLSLTGNDASGLGWIVGADFSLTKTIKTGLFYNGYSASNSADIYNHYFGISLKYSFAY